MYNKENRNRGTNKTAKEITVNRNSRKVFHEQSAFNEHLEISQGRCKCYYILLRQQNDYCEILNFVIIIVFATISSAGTREQNKGYFDILFATSGPANRIQSSDLGVSRQIRHTERYMY